MNNYAYRCFTVSALFAASAVLWSQAPGSATAAPAGGAATSVSSGGTGGATALFAPSISGIHQALATLRVEKWKASSAVIQETASNISSIQRDIDATLPGLLAAADRNGAPVADALPAYRNVEALYDVVLRVWEVAKLGAPAQQNSVLQQATGTLEDARRTFGDRLQAAAAAEARSISALQAQLRTLQTAPPQPSASPVCVTPPAASKKRTPATRPKPKPMTPQGGAATL